MSPLELTAALLSAAGVALTIRRTLLCWPVSLVASLLYAWVFLDARLYADTALQGIFCGCLLYGWLLWHDDEASSPILIIRRPSRSGLAAGLALALLGAVAWSLVLSRWTDDPMPVTDATLSAFSILGQIWAARRYIASWIVWIVVDLCYVVLFSLRALYPTAILYAAFVVLAVYGLQNWRHAPTETHRA